MSLSIDLFLFIFLGLKFLQSEDIYLSSEMHTQKDMVVNHHNGKNKKIIKCWQRFGENSDKPLIKI